MLVAVTCLLTIPLNPVVEAMGIDSIGTSVTLPTDSVAAFSPLVRDELDYYFDRHNVQDEGYEMVVAFSEGHRHQVTISGPVSIWNIGIWNGHSRQGAGVVLDSLGRTVVGIWEADTLDKGVRLDSLGAYCGDFRGLSAEGHGSYQSVDGSYFEGHWEQDRRQGFGLELLSDDGEPRLRVGEWSRSRFMGERMRYTTERIYGIDIARYQHGHGRRKLPIDWGRMRISYLGHRNNKNVAGTADYPVSFIFIKSTEGTTIRNPHYLADYRQARQHNIPIGAYHFFSVKSSGTAQAQFFLKNTRFVKGDLPPVLDVEPSDAQIALAGGSDKMFAQIRIWLQLVEQRVGIKPILYVNQRFVNMYLSSQPDLKRDYRVWIARYGEYKPDVRLAFWQLSSDGRVSGIHGDVDINVFNGYKSQFDDFLDNETIKQTE